jgi:hypothetical protein
VVRRKKSRKICFLGRKNKKIDTSAQGSSAEEKGSKEQNSRNKKRHKSKK